MWPDRVSNPGPLTYESGALPIALRSPATIFSVYIVHLKSQITYLFVKFCCSISIFLSSANLIYRSTDISKCFRGSLQLRDNQSRLYK